MVTLLPLLLVVLPLLVGISLVACGDRLYTHFAKSIALWASGVFIALSIWLWFAVSQGTAFQTETRATLPPIHAAIQFAPAALAITAPGGFTLQFALGADSLGAVMVLLTALVGWGVLSIATQQIEERFSSYAGWIFLAQAGLMLVFLSLDVLVFYIGFELALLPLLVLITGWGDVDSGRIAKRFVLFTLAGSIPMVLALIGIIWLYSTPTSVATSFSDLSALAVLSSTSLEQQQWIFALLTLGLGIKMALIPGHTWLPDTYRASAPTTSALLAAVVLKMGLFGFLRIAIPMLPLASERYGTVVLGTLGAVAIIYGGLCALAQRDLRMLLAYSSLSHVGFITLGMFSLTSEGVAGGALQMFNHGITTAAMFLLAGCLIHRRGTAEIKGMGQGLATVYPRLAVLTIFFLIAGAGMPGASNFVGELLALSGMMAKYPSLAVAAIGGVLLGAWYSLRLAKDLLFGSVQSKSPHGRRVFQHDLSLVEWLPLTILVGLSLFIGLWPQAALLPIQADTDRLLEPYRRPNATVAISPLPAIEKASSTALTSTNTMESAR